MAEKKTVSRLTFRGGRRTSAFSELTVAGLERVFFLCFLVLVFFFLGLLVFLPSFFQRAVGFEDQNDIICFFWSLFFCCWRCATFSSCFPFSAISWIFFGELNVIVSSFCHLRFPCLLWVWQCCNSEGFGRLARSRPRFFKRREK